MGKQKRRMPRGWHVHRDGAKPSIERLIMGAMIFGGVASRCFSGEVASADNLAIFLPVSAIVGTIAWYRGFFHALEKEADPTQPRLESSGEA